MKLWYTVDCNIIYDMMFVYWKSNERSIYLYVYCVLSKSIKLNLSNGLVNVLNIRLSIV